MSEKIKILFLSASPRDLTTLNPDTEFRRIFEEVGSSSAFEMLSVSTITKGDLIPVLLKNRPDIVHFTGHGSEDGIYFENDIRTKDLFNKNDLAELFTRLHQKPRILFLSSCLSAPNIENLSRVIDFVIATEDRVEEKAATHIAATFYTHLGYGEPIKNSFDLVHSQLKHLNMESEIVKYKLFVRAGAKNEVFTAFDRSPGKNGSSTGGVNIRAKNFNVAEVIYQTIYN